MCLYFFRLPSTNIYTKSRYYIGMNFKNDETNIILTIKSIFVYLILNVNMKIFIYIKFIEHEVRTIAFILKRCEETESPLINDI